MAGKKRSLKNGSVTPLSLLSANGECQSFINVILNIRNKFFRKTHAKRNGEEGSRRRRGLGGDRIIVSI